MNINRGLERTLPDQENITASFSQETPLLINGTLKYFSSQGGNF